MTVPDVTPCPKPAPKKPASKRRPINPVSDRKRERRAATETSDAYKDVLCRSNGRCEQNPLMPAEHMHHRRRRSQGGRETVVNLLHLSNYWHSLVHGYPDWARRHGLLLGTGDDPAVCVLGHELSCRADHRLAARPTREEAPK